MKRKLIEDTNSCEASYLISLRLSVLGVSPADDILFILPETSHFSVEEPTFELSGTFTHESSRLALGESILEIILDSGSVLSLTKLEEGGVLHAKFTDEEK